MKILTMCSKSKVGVQKMDIGESYMIWHLCTKRPKVLWKLIYVFLYWSGLKIQDIIVHPLMMNKNRGNYLSNRLIEVDRVISVVLLPVVASTSSYRRLSYVRHVLRPLWEGHFFAHFAKLTSPISSFNMYDFELHALVISSVECLPRLSLRFKLCSNPSVRSVVPDRRFSYRRRIFKILVQIKSGSLYNCIKLFRHGRVACNSCLWHCSRWRLENALLG
mmetsp:Transcript_19338/g.31672  ORF Transcript_19338/g.31672 Transcript_19338/m.31672 type:complete len:219 (+) Transcript_19338:220-876(+)